MASDVLSACINDPNFTIICMFIEKFSSACGINTPSIYELSKMLENTSEVAPPLEEIHIKLLRKIKKTVPTNRWENALAKFAYSYSNQDAWELERFGYKNSSIAVKLRVLKALLEAQFDRNAKFKGHINSIAAGELRSEPIGKDKFGNNYWCILDQQCNIHIFRENLDDETWKVVASNRDEVTQLIGKLKDKDFLLSPSQEIEDEDTSSTSNLSNVEDYSATLKKDAKETSLIIERRVYKKADEIINARKSESKEINLNELTDSADQEKDEEEDKSNKDEKIVPPLDDTVEEPIMLIKGEGSGAECEAAPIFSEVIEEPTLFIYGLGNGVQNEMGNIKTGNDSKSEEIIPSSSGKNENFHKSEQKDLPLKKKINKNYNLDTHHDTAPTLIKSDDTMLGDKQSSKVLDEKRIESKNDVTLESSILDSKEKDATRQIKEFPNESISSNSSLENNSLKEKCSSTIQENADSSYEVLLPKKENQICSKMSIPEQEHVDDKHLSVSKKPQEIPLKVESSSNNDALNVEKTPTIDEKSSLPPKARRGRKPRSGIVDGLDISQVIIDKTENGSPPIRQSRRIAQQKIQEETNRRLIEEKMLRQMKAEAMKKKKENKQKVIKSDDDDEDYIVSEEDSRHTESKTKMKKKNDKPWMNSSSESSSESEPEEDYIEHDHSDLPSMKSDHEFSPESDLEDETFVPIKRARTARVEKFSDNESVDSDIDHSCQKCGKADHPEWILLCDSCDKGYHCSCLVPVLFIIPEGDWFCPLCQHEKLISNLESKLIQFDEFYEKKKADEELQKQIALEQKLTSVKNDDNDLEENENSDTEVLKNQKNRRYFKKSQPKSEQNSSLSSDENLSDKHSNDDTDSDDVPIYKLRKRNTSNLSFKLNEYDNLIKSAIDRSSLISPDSPPTHGKDIRNIVKAVKKEEEKLNRSHSNSPVPAENKKQNKTSVKKKKKLNNLDISSEEDDESDEDFSENIASSEDDDSFSMTEDSESSLEFLGSKKSRAAANKKKDRDFINDDDDSDHSGAYNIRKRPNKSKKILDDSDEFNDDEDVTESEEIDSEDLCNDTETDSSADSWKKRKLKPKVVSRAPVKTSDNNKKKSKKGDDDKTYKSGIRKRPAFLESDSDSSNKQDSELTNKRRTRGKKLHYLIDDDFESSDDGITPGVHRPDTPPEEREKFIKKQEEIKRMLAEKNTAAAKELATPMIEPLNVNDKNRQSALSTIPAQVIESAKVLDIDFLRSSKHLDSDDFDEDLAVNLPDPDVNEEELAKIMEEEDFAQHQLKLDDLETNKSLSIAETPPKKKIRHFDSIDPTKITKSDKKTGHAGTAERKVDAVCSNLVNYLQSKIPPNTHCPISGDAAVNKYEPSGPIYHSLNPPPVGPSSLLEQMKQQAIPLQDSLTHPTPLILDSKKPYADTVPPPPPTLLPLTSTLPPSTLVGESKEGVTEIRRRRRKKITPLRGDLYKVTMDSRLLDTTKSLHYSGPQLPAGAIHSDKLFPYSLPKPPSSTVAPTFACNTTKLSDSQERYPNPCSFILPPDYNPGFGSTTNTENPRIISEPVSSTLNDQPRQTFASLEPVNNEDPVPEQTIIAIGSSQNSQESEDTSEFSGLVSYFSSQQNELNA